MKDHHNILICGNYGADNIGDEAILDGMLALVRQAAPHAKITILSGSPGAIPSLHLGVTAAPLFPVGFRSFFAALFKRTFVQTFSAFSRADLFVLGGGGLFTDHESLRAPLIWALQARLARIYKLPIACFGQSIGPLRTRFARFMTKQTMKAAQAITVRDDNSLHILADFGISQAEQLTDFAFALLPEVKEAMTLPSPLTTDFQQNPYIVISVRPWQEKQSSRSLEQLAQFCRWVWEAHSCRIVCIPFERRDTTILQELIPKIALPANAVHLLPYTTDRLKIFRTIVGSQATIGMRLHSLIFSSLCSVPFVALSYSSKVTSFSQDMDMGSFTIPWLSLSFQDLSGKFEMLLSDRKNLVKILRKNTEKNYDRVQKHREILEHIVHEPL